MSVRPAAAGRGSISRTRHAPVRWVAASLWTMLLAGGVAAFALGLLLHRGDPESAGRIANAEIEALLDPGERVAHRVRARQRYWWDYYRITHGVLAATNRRLLFVGIPPEPILGKRDGPPEMITVSFPYTRAIVVSRQRVFLLGSGVVLAGATDRAEFGIARYDRIRLDSVLTTLGRHQAAIRAMTDAQRRAAEVAMAASRRPIYYLVQRGDALEMIANRYGTTVDSLMAWNDLSTSRIQVGRRLLVRPGQ